MNYRLTFVVLIILALSGSCATQSFTPSITQVDSLVARDPKPMLILLSTDWCVYCHLQKAQLRRNKEFQAKQQYFHFIEFDAESREQVRFGGEDYAFVPTGANTGIHELAVTLNGPDSRIAFPTWILLSPQYDVLFRHNGALSSSQLKELLDAIVRDRASKEAKNTATDTTRS